MPRLNTRADIIQGLGLVWLTDDLVIGQRQQPDGSWAVCSGPTVAGPWDVLEKRGCNFIAAGGGHWAAFGGTIFGPAAVPGAAIPAGLDGRGAGSPDGTVALIKHSETGGLILRRLDGTIFEVPGAFPTSNLCVVDRDRALWVDARDGRVHTCGGLPVPLTLPGPVLWPAVFFAVNRWWIAYHSTDAIGYVCHPFDSLDGYPIAKPPAFYPNAVVIDGSTARLAWSLDAAESPAGLRSVFQDLTAPRVPLGVVAPPTPHPVPEPPPMPDTPQAPNRKSVIVAVIAAHPEIDTRDENSLDKGRAAITDWTAQRLNRETGRRVWGRKSRGKPTGDVAVNPNTDGLTYLRSDGRFEIIDAINGGDGTAAWENNGAFAAGENGYWVPPQLGPEPTSGGEPAPTPQPPSGLPTLDQWIHGEYPQLVAAYASRHGGNEPPHEWAAFQTCRRGGVMLPPGEAAWSFAKMLAHELAQ
jgi:hypothetical protein